MRNDLVARLAELDERMAGMQEGEDPDTIASAGPDPSADLLGATIEITDADGRDVGAWRVEGGGLQRALRGLELQELRAGAAGPAASDEGGDDGSEPDAP